MDQVFIWCLKFYHTFLLLLILNIVKVEGKRCSPDSHHPCKLYAAGFFPLIDTIPQSAIGRGVMPAVDLALQSINSKPVVIEGYHLDLVRKDTEVSVTFTFSFNYLSNFTQCQQKKICSEKNFFDSYTIKVNQ